MGRRDLRDAVVVITGASSGIGRCAAMMFAAKGAHVVLAARHRAELEAAARQVQGPDPVIVTADVASRRDVVRLGEEVLERKGRIDVWVNAAAVAAYGRFDEIPEPDFRQVIETNLFGYVHGCEVALPVMRRQGSGTIVNIASIVSRIPAPYLSPYAVSKAAVRSLGGCLRAELLDEPGVRVCTVHPGTVDTPFFRHAANHTGREVQPIPPVMAVERAARAVVRCAERPRPDVYVGLSARAAVLQATVAPHLSERLVGRYLHRAGFTDRLAVRTTGNLYDPLGPQSDEARVDVPRPGDTAEAPVTHDEVVDVREHPDVPAR